MPARSWILGFALVLLGRLWIVLPWVYLLFAVAEDPRSMAPIHSMLAFVLAVICSPPMIYLGLRLASAVPSESAAQDPRAPVVFLRPFDDDGQARGSHDLLGDESFGWFGQFLVAIPVIGMIRRTVKGYLGALNRTLEQELQAGLVDYGPMVAIGRPGEKIQTIGAERLYMREDRWQEQVEMLLRAAQIVIWQSGDSKGAMWELAALVRQADPQRILLVIPSPAKRPSRFQALRPLINAVLPKDLPDSRDDVSLVTFSDDWTPALHAYKYFRPNERLLEISGFDVRSSLLPLLGKLPRPAASETTLRLSRRWRKVLLDSTMWASPLIALGVVLTAQEMNFESPARAFENCRLEAAVYRDFGKGRMWVNDTPDEWRERVTHARQSFWNRLPSCVEESEVASIRDEFNAKAEALLPGLIAGWRANVLKRKATVDAVQRALEDVGADAQAALWASGAVDLNSRVEEGTYAVAMSFEHSVYFLDILQDGYEARIRDAIEKRLDALVGANFSVVSVPAGSQSAANNFPRAIKIKVHINYVRAPAEFASSAVEANSPLMVVAGKVTLHLEVFDRNGTRLLSPVNVAATRKVEGRLGYGGILGEQDTAIDYLARQAAAELVPASIGCVRGECLR